MARDPHTCPECGAPLELVDYTRFRDWDCGNRSVPTRLLGPLIIIVGFLMAMTRLALLGLFLAFAGGYLLLAHTERCTRRQCPECGYKEDPLGCKGDDLTGNGPLE